MDKTYGYIHAHIEQNDALGSGSYSSIFPGPIRAPYGSYAADGRGHQTEDTPAAPNPPAAGKNLVQQITGQQLRFDYLSADVLRQMLYERQTLRDRNHANIAGQITDVSGEISC